MVYWRPLSNGNPLCAHLVFHTLLQIVLFDQFPLKLMHIHLFQAIRNLFISPGFERQKVIVGYCDEICVCLTAFSAVLFLVIAEVPWQTEWYCRKWCNICLFGQYTRIYLDEFGQQFSVKWWKLKRSQLHTQVTTKPSTHTLFSHSTGLINTQWHCNQASSNQRWPNT